LSLTRTEGESSTGTLLYRHIAILNFDYKLVFMY